MAYECLGTISNSETFHKSQQSHAEPSLTTLNSPSDGFGIKFKVTVSTNLQPNAGVPNFGFFLMYKK